MAEHETTIEPESLLAHAGWVRGIARALCADHSRADDVVQDTWVAALEQRECRVLDLRAWLAGVLRNIVREDRRAEGRRARREERAAEPERVPSAEDLVEKAEMQQRVVRAVLDLKEPYRATLLLRFFEELSCEEIARRESLPASTVRNRQMRALAQVRERLEHDHGGDPRVLFLNLVPLALPPCGAKVAAATGGAVALSQIVQVARVERLVQVVKGGSVMKGLIAVAAVLVVGGGVAYTVLAGQGEEAREPTTARAGAGTAPDESATTAQGIAPEQADSQRSRVPDESARGATAVQGRVLDRLGRPIAGARLFAGAPDSPFEEPQAAFQIDEQQQLEGGPERWLARELSDRQAENVAIGRFFETGADGTFSIDPGRPHRVFVLPLRSPGVRPDERAGRSIDAPAEVDFHATRVPIGTLAVTVTDRTTGAKLDRFRGTITARGEARPFTAESEVFEGRLELEGGAETVSVAVTEPLWAQSNRSLVLSAGTSQRADFFVTSGPTFHGRVTDAASEPLANALVFWGDTSRLRGRGWFGALDPERVFDGVRSDDEGHFALPGSADQVTAWHDEHSPVTVRAIEVDHLALPPRGTIEGHFVDDQGAPLAGIRVTLDRERETTTDDRGRYAFDRVPAGVHGLGNELRFFVGLELGAGQTLVVAPAERLDEVRVEVRARDESWDEKFGGGIFGLDPMFTVHEAGVENGAFTIRRVLPGRYVMQAGGARFAAFTVGDTGRSVADFGDADLSVETEPGAIVYLVPELVANRRHLFGERMRKEVPETGLAVFDPLPRGRYEVGIVGRGTVTTIDVAGPGARAKL